MPKKRKKREEILVAAPHFRSKRDTLLEDTTGVEALDVFKISGKIGGRLSGIMIAVGALLSLLSIIAILTSTEFAFSNPFFIGALGFLGATNIFFGLILLAKE